MPMWRCPHCGTPQAETAHCWVCRRSSTACLTCRHFRRSVAPGLGYCALDARRAPLHGDEIRSCWDAGPLPTAPSIAAVAPPTEPDRRPALGFVEVGSVGGPSVMGSPSDAASRDRLAAEAALEVEVQPRWSLWDD